MDPNEQKADEQAALVARYRVRVDIAQTRGFSHGLEARHAHNTAPPADVWAPGDSEAKLCYPFYMVAELVG